ncbi:hypothetical protein ASF26_17690 [Methylobacterium sp. Leaf93]|nr:hypothetical protein ASF26_17690 [Methylobacterium sp. Leaf93]
MWSGRTSTPAKPRFSKLSGNAFSEPTASLLPKAYFDQESNSSFVAAFRYGVLRSTMRRFSSHWLNVSCAWKYVSVVFFTTSGRTSRLVYQPRHLSMIQRRIAGHSA